ncbi:MAG: Wzz/FepE/Etk N-terminal domain-containing protein [Pseudomonadota bacterium]
MEDTLMTIGDYLQVVRRRKWSLILPMVAVIAIAAAVALLLPPVYKSTATILIEEQEIPDEFVRATVTSYAEQRIQAINQWIMSSTKLLEIINRLGLYEEMRAARTTEEVIARMRADTKLEMINAEVIDPRSGRPAEATIAFSLSYQGKTAPQKVQAVANELASLFLERNLNVRVQQTQETSAFLESELKKVKDALDALEARIAVYKEQNIAMLPEMLQVNAQTLNNLERASESLDAQLRSLKEREGYLEAQLANVSPSLEEQQEDRQRLDLLKIQLVELRTRFTDEYPDVVKTRTEIADLTRQMEARRSDPESSDKPDNPAFITLAAQLSSARAEIVSVQGQMRDLAARIEDFRSKIANTPRVEEAYRALVSERNNTQAKYDDLMKKLMDARVSQGLEKEQKGERFTLIDPARFPEKPFKPNRLAILLIGVVLGIGAGVGMAALREFTDTCVHSADALSRMFQAPVLAVVPVILSAGDLRRRRLRRISAAAGAVVIVAAAVAVFHYQVMDLEVFWVKLMRRLTL